MAVQSGIELIGFGVSSVLLVTLALGGHGAMSLAWSRAAAQIVVVVCLQLVVAKRYLPGFRRDQARDILATRPDCITFSLLKGSVGCEATWTSTATPTANTAM